MPRDLPIGNGRLLVTFDANYCVRDIYYPRVGKENQTLGERCRTGVWVNGAFSWLHEEGWRRSLKYLPDTLVTDVELSNDWLRLRIQANDCVHPEHSVFLRSFTVFNDSDEDREFRLFFHYDLNLLENAIGDTAFYEPVDDVVVQYKGPRYFLLNARNAVGEGIYQYSTGVKRLQHFEGTWRDAEDGQLGGNPITQGAVDCIVSVRATIPARSSAKFHHWVCVEKSYFAAKELNDIVTRGSFDEFQDTVTNHWRKWVGQARTVNYAGEGAGPLAELYRRSLLIVNTQIDSGGAIIAANDSDSMVFNRDTYSYMWPRDGALVSHALDRAGFPELTRKFFLFCENIMPSNGAGQCGEQGYLRHKFNPDGSLGSSWHAWIRDGKPVLPIQEDETALVLWALYEHLQLHKDAAFVTSLTDRLIRPAARFLLHYRDTVTGLPRESYDLWEERYGVLTFTTVSVIAGLKSAGEMLSKAEDAALRAECFAAAATMKQAMSEILFSKDDNRFLRMVSYSADGGCKTDATIDASIYAIFYFGIFDLDDPRVVSTMEQMEARLWCKTERGGVARYERDYYYQISHDIQNVCGNPWIICTLWLAMWYVAKAKTQDELRRPRELLDWVAKHAMESGCMAEQIHPYSGAPLSASPLTWSHATYIETVLRFWEKCAAIS